jgi:hypothetical protein
LYPRELLLETSATYGKEPGGCVQSTKGGLDELRQTRGDLLCARLSALQAQVSLSGAREKRARELTEKIADALAHVERLTFYVESDSQ